MLPQASQVAFRLASHRFLLLLALALPACLARGHDLVIGVAKEERRDETGEVQRTIRQARQEVHELEEQEQADAEATAVGVVGDAEVDAAPASEVGEVGEAEVGTGQVHEERSVGPSVSASDSPMRKGGRQQARNAMRPPTATGVQHVAKNWSTARESPSSGILDRKDLRKATAAAVAEDEVGPQGRGGSSSLEHWERSEEPVHEQRWAKRLADHHPIGGNGESHDGAPVSRSIFQQCVEQGICARPQAPSLRPFFLATTLALVVLVSFKIGISLGTTSIRVYKDAIESIDPAPKRTFQWRKTQDQILAEVYAEAEANFHKRNGETPATT